MHYDHNTFFLPCTGCSSQPTELVPPSALLQQPSQPLISHQLGGTNVKPCQILEDKHKHESKHRSCGCTSNFSHLKIVTIKYLQMIFNGHKIL